MNSEINSDETSYVMVNGLRIYINESTPGATSGDRVFYSRRADGPYYRWRYEKQIEQWRGPPVHAADFSPRELSMSNSKTVPSALQSRLIDHYQEQDSQERPPDLGCIPKLSK